MSRWIHHCSGPVQQRLNLLCFPYAGAGAAYYARWMRYYRRAVQLLPVQLPMRDTRLNEPMPESFQALAEQMVTESPELFDLPFGLFGHCSGAFMAYETALAARRILNKSAAILIISSAVAPEHLHMVQTRDWPEAQFLKHYKAEAMVAQWDASYRAFFMPILRADCLLTESYCPTAADPLETKLILMRGASDEALKPAEHFYDWSRRVTRPAAAVLTYSGDHFFVDRETEAVAGDLIDLLTVPEGGEI